MAGRNSFRPSNLYGLDDGEGFFLVIETGGLERQLPSNDPLTRVDSALPEACQCAAHYLRRANVWALRTHKIWKNGWMVCTSNPNFGGESVEAPKISLKQQWVYTILYYNWPFLV
ncbi:uncharacterized protein PGTG_16604 [Puccinia graminis f. sp. tritici CRL 75-36-700-3]|uniref:Uncharacterized protein n=1 Tax=Puccinia graminis f. sp. tritici (strain CRL 75-36-700-3 / race SCCL) TaxID=418459 RepID=E3L203_PUCGT|nr:uncharacterized protein PGTG_16604 [Puccinia graminis f. sp. tritici CRL 75-36-700-3]EFP90578.1 hypothetical protein PGTG_16604 [Puccinia graminis f. sp. tritici CRL 75-36-700-3]